MDDNEGSYEILPYKEIADLKKQIKDLKGNPASSDIVVSMNHLAKNMDNMLSLFRTASKDMEDEVKEESFISKNIKPLTDKIDKVIDQNKTIAEGMVTIADMVKDFINKFDNGGPLDMPPSPDDESLDSVDAVGGSDQDDFGSTMQQLNPNPSLINNGPVLPSMPQSPMPQTAGAFAKGQVNVPPMSSGAKPMPPPVMGGNGPMSPLGNMMPPLPNMPPPPQGNMPPPLNMPPPPMNSGGKKKGLLSFRNKKMETENPPNVKRIKKLLKHLSRVSSYHYGREKARADLSNHLSKIKGSVSKKSFKQLFNQVAKLDEKVDSVIQQETRLIQMGKQDNLDNAKLRQQISYLTHELAKSESASEKINRLNDSLHKLEMRVKDHMQSKADRHERIKDIENKVQSRFILKTKLKELEDKYYNLLNSGNVDSNRLNLLREKINTLKARA